MMKTTYRLATVWGIPIQLHISLLIPLVYFYFGLRALPGVGPVGALGLVLVIAVFVFTSIALHELGHSFVAIRKGCRVSDITLMFMGGVAKMESMPRRPRDELLMAIAGPAVSIVLGALSILAGIGLAVAHLGLAAFIAWGVGYWNFFLAGFNLIPAFPMDGGRVLRALLTPKLGRLKATYIASRVGRVLAVCLGIAGFVSNNGNFVLVAIAFFVYFAAGREYKIVRLQEMARHAGFGAWNPQDGPPRGDEDIAMIGPPPYAESRGEDQQVQSIQRDAG